jgi:hypothetical protein
MKISHAVLLLLMAVTTGHGQSSLQTRKTKLKELSFLIGQWNVTIDRKNASGESTVETGLTMSFAFDMDSTAIRNERHFKKNNFYEYIFYNPSRNMYEFIAIENGAASAARPWLVDLQQRSYRYNFSYYDTSKKITVETIVTMKYVNANELVESFEGIVFETGAREFFNTLRLTR